MRLQQVILLNAASANFYAAFLLTDAAALDDIQMFVYAANCVTKFKQLRAKRLPLLQPKHLITYFSSIINS